MTVIDADTLLERVGKWEHNPDNSHLFSQLSEEIRQVSKEGGFDVPAEIGRAIGVYIDSIDEESDKLKKRLDELTKERKVLEEFFSKHFHIEI